MKMGTQSPCIDIILFTHNKGPLKHSLIYLFSNFGMNQFSYQGNEINALHNEEQA